MKKTNAQPGRTQEWFEVWFDSPYYSILYKNRDDQEARRFIDHLLQIWTPPPGARMLDLACGKGRHAIYLAEKGYQVTGLDLSANNIHSARQSAKDNLQFFVHDMRLPFQINNFDYIFNIFTSFGYFEQEKDHLNTLKNIAGGLRSGGSFILDFFNSNYVINHLPAKEEKEIEDIHFKIEKRIRRNRVIKSIDFQHGGREHHFVEKVRLFSLDDFQDLFSRAGLQIGQVFGDYRLQPFSLASSPRLILIANQK